MSQVRSTIATSTDAPRLLLTSRARRLERTLDRALSERQGLRLPHYDALERIAARPGSTQRELVESSAVDASTMVSIVDELELRGYAERRENPSDRRKHALHLTDRGAEALDRARQAVTEVEEGIFGALNSEERGQLERLLRSLEF